MVKSNTFYKARVRVWPMHTYLCSSLSHSPIAKLPAWNVRRLVLEEARAKLGQDSDVSSVTRDGPGGPVGQQGELLESKEESTRNLDAGRESREGADQSASASVSPL